MDAGKIYNSWPLMGNIIFQMIITLMIYLMITALSEPSLVQFIHRNLAYINFGYFYYNIFFYIKKN